MILTKRLEFSETVVRLYVVLNEPDTTNEISIRAKGRAEDWQDSTCLSAVGWSGQSMIDFARFAVSMIGLTAIYETVSDFIGETP